MLNLTDNAHQQRIVCFWEAAVSSDAVLVCD